MTHAGLVILVIISFEIINFFKLIDLIKLNFQTYKKLLSSFLEKNLDDEAKQNQILDTSKKLLLSSIKILICLLIIFALFFSSKLIMNDLYNLILSYIGILETTIFFVIYLYLRKYINAKL